jgi:hypothetical protein
MVPAPRSTDLKLTGLMGSLRCSQPFSGLPPEDLAVIAAFTVSQTLAKGDDLFHGRNRRPAPGPDRGVGRPRGAAQSRVAYGTS